MKFLKVSSKSSPASVAGAIAGMIKDGAPVEIQSVGAGAVNQAIKAIAIARGFLIPTGFDIMCTPSFSDIIINDEKRTALRLSVFARPININPQSADTAACTEGALNQEAMSFLEADSTIDSCPSAEEA